jgi:hypothetical protein
MAAGNRLRPSKQTNYTPVGRRRPAIHARTTGLSRLLEIRTRSFRLLSTWQTITASIGIVQKISRVVCTAYVPHCCRIQCPCPDRVGRRWKLAAPDRVRVHQSPVSSFHAFDQDSWWPATNAENAERVGPRNQGGPIQPIEFVHHHAHVVFDTLAAHVQPRGQLYGRDAGGHSFYDLGVHVNRHCPEHSRAAGTGASGVSSSTKHTASRPPARKGADRGPAAKLVEYVCRTTLTYGLRWTHILQEISFLAPLVGGEITEVRLPYCPAYCSGAASRCAATRPARPVTPSFRYTFVRCFSTARQLTPKESAISWFV